MRWVMISSSLGLLLLSCAAPVLSKPIALFVDKSEKVLYLCECQEDDWIISKTYPVILGQEPGPKKREGDLRTPEGEYRLIQEKAIKDGEVELEGFLLDYPNDRDRRLGRTGSGIYIHETLPKPHTKGCIGLSFKDYKDLRQHIRVGTPVIIRTEIKVSPSSDQ